MSYIGKTPTSVPLTSSDITDGIITSAKMSAGTAGLLDWQSVHTSATLTAVAGRGYYLDTTSNAITVTLPASPSVGNQIALVDYAGTFDTNALTIDPNGNKIEGATINLLLDGEREGVILTYTDSTQGWLATSGINEGTDALEPAPYSVDFLVIAGGGGGGWDIGGGGGAGGYRNSFSTEASGGGGSSETSLTFALGTVYTVTVGGGGTGAASAVAGGDGVDSSISGTGITTITSTGGGGAGSWNSPANGNAGGSGGGAGGFTLSGSGGAGTANQGFAGGNNSISTSAATGGAGGGAGGVGGNSISDEDGFSTRGLGLASSITGSSVTRAEGGRGGGDTSPGVTNGGANTGTGGDGSGNSSSGNGGSGVVILSMPLANFSNTTTGSPTESDDGTTKQLIFNASGSYTG